jgi:hypothetical protein
VALAFSSAAAVTSTVTHDNGLRISVPYTLGHSGGAVPDLNRSSLFVGISGRNADHQRTLQGQNVALRRALVKQAAQKKPDDCSSGSTGARGFVFDETRIRFPG